MSLKLKHGFAVTAAALAIAVSAPTQATERANYPFSAAAEEIAQLFWLAETANVCGWASAQETERFEQFAVRFISAHLQGTYQIAFNGMVGDQRYLNKVRTVAAASAKESCQVARWQHGWLTYKAAADENDTRY